MIESEPADPWVASVDGAPRVLPVWATLPVAVVAAAVIVVAGRFVGGWADISVGRVLPEGRWRELAQTAVFTLVIFLPLAAVAVAATRFEGRSAWLADRHLPAWAGLSTVLGIGGFSLAIGLAALAGVVVPGAGGPTGAAALVGVVGGLVLFGIQAGAEEVYFRGWLQPVLCARWGPMAGLVVTSLLFALLHVAGGARSGLALANLFLGGLFFGLLAIRTGGLWAPFLAHLGWNWVEACGFGLEPNPGLGPTGALVDLDVAGWGLWSGGADRMNGSLASSLVLLVLVIGLTCFGRNPLLRSGGLRSAADRG